LIVIRVSKIRKFENPNLCVARSKPFAADLRRKAQIGKSLTTDFHDDTDTNRRSKPLTTKEHEGEWGDPQKAKVAANEREEHE